MANHEHDDDRQGEEPRRARRALLPLGKRGPKGKILVVDDLGENRYMLRALLEGHGHCVVEASNGQEALDLGRISPPDCVISDLLMPVMDGFTLCREWVRDERVGAIPFVVYTATYTGFRDQQLALQLGARRYIRKPLAPEGLVAVIEEVMEAAARGELPPPTARTAEVQVGELVLYNERLVRKLEHRMLELAEARTEIAASERRYKELFDHAPHAYFCVGLDGRIQMANEAAERLVGRPGGDLVGVPVLDLYADAPEGKAKAEQVLARFRADAAVEGEQLAMQRPDGTLAWVRLSVHPTHDERGRAVSSRSIAVDITKDKRAQDIAAARLRLLEIAHERPLDELLTAMLDELEELTGSSIGFFHLVDVDQTTLTLQAWSTRTRDRCSVVGGGRKYDVAQAGVWIDCLRERRPVVHNDYSSLAHRKGLPDGHVPVVREAAAPVFRGDRVRAI
jgi:PAS domain S-box-containing protein